MNKLRDFLKAEGFVAEAFFLDPKGRRNSDEQILAFIRALEK